MTWICFLRVCISVKDNVIMMYKNIINLLLYLFIYYNSLAPGSEIRQFRTLHLVDSTLRLVNLPEQLIESRMFGIRFIQVFLNLQND